MKKTLVRRLGIALAATSLVLGAAACGSDDSNGSDAKADGGSVTIVGQKFTEADIMAELYKGLLDDAGFQASVKALGGRDLYLDPLSKGDVQVSTDYLSSMTEALNRKANGDDAPKVASPDATATLAELNKLTAKYGMTALQPAEAQDANAFAVTKKFADDNSLKTLSDLGALGKGVKLGGAEDCPQRPDCQKGLEGTYGLKITGFEPTGFGTAETKDDLAKGTTQLGVVGTTDATLDKLGLVILDDDKHLQNAENLVPIVNTAWLKDHPEAEKALNKLSTVLTTADLTDLIGQVDNDREKPADVAKAYLQDKGLI
ncbi:ABC transporter substrate-binding protein [Marmoricola sp. RAF53]|uniref:ABC transporter substrate-binding protein n=1 Tax=Marmoricola sp. RAF53 TaxID=3233059 RepID=UPI003F954B25